MLSVINLFSHWVTWALMYSDQKLLELILRASYRSRSTAWVFKLHRPHELKSLGLDDCKHIIKHRNRMRKLRGVTRFFFLSVHNRQSQHVRVCPCIYSVGLSYCQSIVTQFQEAFNDNRATHKASYGEEKNSCTGWKNRGKSKCYVVPLFFKHVGLEAMGLIHTPPFEAVYYCDWSCNSSFEFVASWAGHTVDTVRAYS